MKFHHDSHTKNLTVWISLFLNFIPDPHKIFNSSLILPTISDSLGILLTQWRVCIFLLESKAHKYAERNYISVFGFVILRARNRIGGCDQASNGQIGRVPFRGHQFNFRESWGTYELHPLLLYQTISFGKTTGGLCLHCQVERVLHIISSGQIYFLNYLLMGIWENKLDVPFSCNEILVILISIVSFLLNIIILTVFAIMGNLFFIFSCILM